MSKKLKLADIAELAGVSKSTVSFVLNGHAEKHRINKETVARVLRVVDENNYSPSVYARALKSKKTQTFGLVIPDLTNMGFAAIAKSLEQLSLASGYQLLIASTDDDPSQEKKAVANLIERQVDGMMVASCLDNDDYYQTLTKETPIVFFDRGFESERFSVVTTNAYDSTKEIVFELTGNAQECAFIGGQLSLSPSRERYQGFVDALKERELLLQPELVFNQDYQPQSGYDMMQQCVEQLGRLPEALFTGSYSLLEGVLRYLNEHDLMADASQQSMRLATFDNYSILDCLPLKIDSIEQDCQQLALKVFDCLQKTLSNKDYKSNTSISARIHYRRR
ncbi:sucrose operon repressor ScrR LacI family [Vibrio maritimus]|uniref:Autoinducer 2-binding periplasmic protein LuxP n=1 Tax=Vibrio maritimus TaxID=990268 RepID=A0A090RQ87_9VIBR|nr:sucrose operon repressor ScrR LacI family [Vibrio maritimus]